MFGDSASSLVLRFPALLSGDGNGKGMAIGLHIGLIYQRLQRHVSSSSNVDAKKAVKGDVNVASQIYLAQICVTAREDVHEL